MRAVEPDDDGIRPELCSGACGVPDQTLERPDRALIPIQKSSGRGRVIGAVQQTVPVQDQKQGICFRPHSARLSRHLGHLPRVLQPRRSVNVIPPGPAGLEQLGSAERPASGLRTLAPLVRCPVTLSRFARLTELAVR